MPVPEADGGGGCGGFGSLILAVVAVVATVFTAGALAAPAGATLGGMMATGMSVLAGTSTLSGNLAITAPQFQRRRGFRIYFEGWG